MKPSFCRVRVSGLNRHDEDVLTYFCFEHGAEGVSENLPYTQPELRYDPILVSTPHLEVDVFFSSKPDEDFFLQLASRFPKARVEIHVEEQKDWLEEWKKGFEPFCFVEPFWIVPSWRSAPAEARVPLYIDPGMAFGTGTHETTRLAAALLAEYFKTHSNGIEVLDVGTGTGVLAIVAEKLGAKSVVGLDIDPECRRVARENAEKNKSHIQIEDHLLQSETRQFDLVIANIIDGVLLELKPDLLKACRDKTHIVLSGILQDRETSFLEEFLQDTNLQVQERREMGEWAAYWLRPRT